MPFYDHLCPACNRVFRFFSRRPSSVQPVCPRCGGATSRLVEGFRIGSVDGPTEEEHENAVLSRKVDAFLKRTRKGEAAEDVERDWDALVDAGDATKEESAARPASGASTEPHSNGEPTLDPGLYELPPEPLPVRKPTPFD